MNRTIALLALALIALSAQSPEQIPFEHRKIRYEAYQAYRRALAALDAATYSLRLADEQLARDCGPKRKPQIAPTGEAEGCVEKPEVKAAPLR